MKRITESLALLVAGLVFMCLANAGCTSEAKPGHQPSADSVRGEVPTTKPASTEALPVPTRTVEPPRVEDVARTVEELLSAISRSNLTFIRNGTKHTAAEASAHIRAKYEQIRNAIQTPEEFIAKAASRSSVSGKPYLVQFSDGNTQPLGEWLTAQLVKLRAGH